MKKQSKKKVLKPLNKRKPDVQKNSVDMAKAIQLETGFRADDIALVVCMSVILIITCMVVIFKVGCYFTV